MPLFFAPECVRVAYAQRVLCYAGGDFALPIYIGRTRLVSERKITTFPPFRKHFDEKNLTFPKKALSLQPQNVLSFIK